jgi:hypothetical protein
MRITEVGSVLVPYIKGPWNVTWYYTLKNICSFFKFCSLFSLALQPPWALASNFQLHDHFTDSRTPWTSDQLVARPLPKHRTAQIQNEHLHIPNSHDLCGIRTHDPGFRVSEDNACLRQLGCRDRNFVVIDCETEYSIRYIYLNIW